ncbi:MAG: immunoglobulin-like domain-containing protein, partial [Candidatus Taylorbacteria bacterium]
PNIADVVSDTLALVDSSILGGNPDISHITSELTNPLPSSGSHGSTITWISNNSSYISNSGRTIVRPLFGNPNVNVLLTATITKGIIIDTKIFDMTVLAETISPELANASTSLAELEIDVAKDLTIGANLTIANTHAGTTRSSIGLVATGTDKTNFINRYNIAIQTLSDANIASDKLDLLNSSILGGNPDISHIRVALTSPLPSSGSKGSVISWLSRIPEVLTNDGQTITRPAYSFGDVSVNLTATIGLEMPMICSPGDTSCGGIASTTKIFDLTILKLPASTSTMITSTSFTIGSSETSTTSITNIPFGTSKASFISSLTKGEPNQAWTDTGITDPVVTGNSLFVTAQDASTTKEYLITVNADPVNHEKSITAFSFGQTEGVITGTDILVTLPYGTVLTSLIPSITLSGGTVSPIGGIAEDFTNSVVYKVTSDDSSTKDYTVTVRVSPNTAANIVSFGITNPISNGVISGNNITITVPFATSLVNLPITIVISDGASVTPMAGGTTFVEGVPIFYTVTAQDATTTKEYGVTVNIAANNAKDIGSFNFETLSPAVTGIINATNITLSVPYATNITSLIPTIGITGASSSPSSGVANNFSSPVTYTVTAADGSTKDYTVSVIVLHETTPPVITLSGLNSISITVGSSFTDPGATALDNVDGVTAVVVSGTVNTNTVGTYTITYTATDVAGNTATSTRTVIVNAAPVAASVNGGATPAPATTVATTTTIVSKLLSANGDYIFDQYDFSLMMSNWGKVGANGSDYNKSGKVDKYDFALLMLNWGK